MIKRPILLGVPLFGLFFCPPAFSIGPEILAPHRAVYNIKMQLTTPGSGITGINGRFVYEIRGSECEGFASRSRYLIHIETLDGPLLLDQRDSSFESADSKSFNFFNRLVLDGQIEERHEGKAKHINKSLFVTLDSPSSRKLELSRARFLNSYMVKIIETAMHGDHFFSDNLYDPAIEEDGIVIASSFISSSRTLTDKDIQDAKILEKLKGIKAWPVSTSYFKRSEEKHAARMPFVESSFLLFENGVSDNFVMSIADSMISGTITELEFFDKNPCEKGENKG